MSARETSGSPDAQSPLLSSSEANEFGLLRRAINRARNGVIITDCLQLDDPIIFANDAFIKLTGYDRDEVIERNDRCCPHPGRGDNLYDQATGQRGAGMTEPIPTRLLLVDDDAALLEALGFFLTDEGYDIMAWQSGEALRRIMEGDDRVPDAIVLDMLLSGENGRGLCEALKRHDRTGGIPVILMSAHPQAEQQAMDSGADRFVAKPFEVDDMLDAIEWCVARSRHPAIHHDSEITPAAD